MEGNKVFKSPIVEIIKERRSIRNYKPLVLEDKDKNKIMDYINTLKGPFNTKVRFQLVEESSIAEKSGGKIGTYGFIKGATTYIAAIAEEEGGYLEDIGYMLEELILYVTDLGLGTCWLGGTFNRGQFSQHLMIKNNEVLPIVTPIGFPKEKMSLMEKAIRFTAGSNNRKPWTELFYNRDFSSPLKENEAGKYGEALEMVRLAPSASNKQPWRIIKENNQWHFYLKYSKGYAEGLGFNIQKVDIGIAMCHFEMTLRELGVNGNWVIKQEKNEVDKVGAPEVMKDSKYIASWIEA